MKIIVIRHGESLADILNVHEGRADFSLTDKGKAQAQKMANYLKSNYSVNKIYSSTLKRPFETHSVLCQTVNILFITNPDLMEFNNGKLAGLTHEVANILYPMNENIPFDQSIYEMESLKEFRQRSEKVLNEILSQTKDTDTIAIVSHGGMINRLYRSFLNMEYNVNVSYPTADTGIHLWEIENGKRTIVYSNLQKHLEF